MATLRALSAGIAVAIAAISTYTYASHWLADYMAKTDSSARLIPLVDEAQIAAAFAFVYAVVIAFCCVPIWLRLEKRNLATSWAAIFLGFFVTAAAWIMTNLSGAATVSALMLDSIPYSICGGIAGFATWIARPKVAADGT